MMTFLRIAIRFMLMIPMVLSLLWSVLDAWGLGMAILASWTAILLAEKKRCQQMRTRSILVGMFVLSLMVLALAQLLTSLSIFSELLGPIMVLHLRALWVAGGIAGVLLLGIRLLAKRSGVWFSIELGLLSLGCAFAFFPHQYKIIMRPLWLSDFAWSIGLEPSILLGLIGMFLASILSVLTIFERSKRRHISILFMPLLAFLALLFVDPMEMDTPPPPKALEDLQSDASGNNGGQGGSGDNQGSPSQSNQGQGGQGDENDQHANSGQDEKTNGESGGQPPPVAIMLLGDDYNPPQESFYLRQEIQDYYNGFRMIAPTDAAIPYEAARGFPSEAVTFAGPPQNPDRLSLRKKVLTDIALLTSHSSPFALEAPLSITPTINPRPGRFVRTYRTESLAFNEGFEQLLYESVGDSSWDEQYWNYLTKAPEDPRYKELAEEIVGTLDPKFRNSKVAQAFAVKLYLDEKTKYTMKERHENALDPTGEFLFGPTQQYHGYCVHTSHAAVYLWRSLGLPARIGVGYSVPVEQKRGSAVLVLANDAHSWPELYVEDFGWVIIDIAPQQMLDEMGEPPDMEMLDALEELARAAPDSKFRKAIDWKQLWTTYKGPLGRFFLGMLCMCTLALGIRKIRRRLWYRYECTPYWVYVSALDALSEHGIIRNYGESPDIFARRIAQNYPAFSPIMWAYLEMRLTGEFTGEQPDLQEYRRNLKQQIQQQFSWGLRMLRLCNPLTSWWSK